MADNSETCGHCGTANPVGQDFCVKCHQPLTASAEEGIRESVAAEDRDMLFGVGGMLMPGDIAPDDATHHGMPPRRS